MSSLTVHTYQTRHWKASMQYKTLLQFPLSFKQTEKNNAVIHQLHMISYDI